MAVSSLTIHYVGNYPHRTQNSGTDAEGLLVWPLNNYLNEWERTTRWFGDEDTVEYHRLISTDVNKVLCKSLDLP
jgi:hypothetical protein